MAPRGCRRFWCDGRGSGACNWPTATPVTPMCSRVRACWEYRLSTAQFKQALATDLASGLLPVAVIASMATQDGASDCVADIHAALSSTCDGGDANSIMPWLHGDAGPTGVFASCPEHAGFPRRADLADSMAVDTSGLLAASSATALWASTSAKGAALLAEGDAAHVSVELWAVMQSLGVSGIRRRVRSVIVASDWLASSIRSHPRFTLHRVALGNVALFALPPGGSTTTTRANEVSPQVEALVPRLHAWLKARRFADGHVSVSAVAIPTAHTPFSAALATETAGGDTVTALCVKFGASLCVAGGSFSEGLDVARGIWSCLSCEAE